MTPLTSLESILDPSAATTSVAPAPTVPATEPAPTEPPASETAVTAEPETPAPELAEGATDPETGEPIVAAEPAPAAPAAPAAAPRVPKVPTKQDAPPASANDEELPRDVKGLRAANKAEREKRKAVEKREQDILDRLAATETQLREADGQRRQLAAYLQGAKEFAPPGQPQPQQPQIPDAVTQPEERLAWERAEIAKALQQRDQHYAQNLHKQVYETRVLLGQDLMRTRHADYDDMEVLATREAERNPELRQAILSHPSPAQFTYQVGQRIKLATEVQQAGGWDNYYAQTLNAQVEAEVARRLGTGQPTAQPAPASPAAQLASRAAPAAPGTPVVPAARAPAAPPPQSLARVPSATPGNRPQAWNGPASLDDILKPLGT